MSQSFIFQLQRSWTPVRQAPYSQPKPLDGAVRNSLTSPSSEPCLAFRKPAFILSWRHFQQERLCKQKGRFLTVHNICTELLLSREQTQGHPTKALRDDWGILWNMSNTKNTQTHTCIPTPIPFLVRGSWPGPSVQISIQKGKQSRTRPTPGGEQRGNGGKDLSTYCSAEKKLAEKLEFKFKNPDNQC